MTEVTTVSNDKGGDVLEYTHTIAIDFGTSGSGIAVRNNHLKDTMVYALWNGKKDEGMASKCPSVLLLNHEKKFEKFGFDAEKFYRSKRGLEHPERANEYYLFKHFKMCLYKETAILWSMKVEAVDGKKLTAFEIFAMSLEYLKREIISTLDKQISAPYRKIQWILTVPAIWSPAAKQIMKEAAKKAGLGVEDDSSLELVLEPEAAAMFCQKELLSISASEDNIAHCAHYLVVDCGGGTLDMAAHKLTKSADGKITIEEIHQAHGGPYGGFAVNNEFEKLLKGLFQLSTEDMKTIIKQHSRQWMKLLHDDFEKSKCSDIAKETTVLIHKRILDDVKAITKKDITQLVDEYKRCKVEWDEDEGLVLPYVTMYNLFLPVITQIIEAIDEVLQKPECQCIEKILLVGGFAVCKFLFDEVKKTFSPNKDVKLSSSPLLAVLKGAVLYGSQKGTIKSRKMRQSIGIETWDDFSPGTHNETKKIERDGKYFCTNIFTKFVEINESVPINNKIEHVFMPASKYQDICKISIIGSYEPKAVYTDEDCCYIIGVLTVTNLPKYDSGVSQAVKVVMDVSGTEVTVATYCNSTSQRLPAKLDFVKDKYVELYM